jgi:predicted AAA+ superfamily ATPase
VPPLQLNEKRNLFKLFMGDVGLLCAACMENIQFSILNGDLSINMGSILENVMAMQLKSNGYSLYYYDTKKYGEVEADPEDLGIPERFSEKRKVEPYTTTDKYGDEVIKRYRTYVPQSSIDEKTALDKVKYYQQNPTKEMKEFADFVLNNTSVNSFLKNLRGK